VGNISVIEATFIDTRKLTWKQNLINVINVRNASIIEGSFAYTREFTQERNPINVMNVEKTSVEIPTFVPIK